MSVGTNVDEDLDGDALCDKPIFDNVNGQCLKDWVPSAGNGGNNVESSWGISSYFAVFAEFISDIE